MFLPKGIFPLQFLWDGPLHSNLTDPLEMAHNVTHPANPENFNVSTLRILVLLQHYQGGSQRWSENPKSSSCFLHSVTCLWFTCLKSAYDILKQRLFIFRNVLNPPNGSRHIASCLRQSFSQLHIWLPVDKYADLIVRDPSFETVVALTTNKNKPADCAPKIQKACLTF